MTNDARQITLFGAAIILAGQLTSVPVAHADNEQISSSTGYSLGADTTILANPAKEIYRQSAQDKYLPDGFPASKSRDATQRSAGHSGFWVYDARATLYVDEDNDGFYSGLNVSFDVDTDFFAADVYARLYLSLDGGPWIRYFTTDVFTVIGTSGTDDYVVETDLLEGYPTGYYELLIELYDYDFHEHVASFGPLESSNLSSLPLEDLTRELGIVSPPVPPVSHSSGGGGSLGFAVLVLSLFWLLRRRLARPGSSGSRRIDAPHRGSPLGQSGPTSPRN